MSRTQKNSKPKKPIRSLESMSGKDPDLREQINHGRKQADGDLHSVEKWARSGYRSGVSVDDTPTLTDSEEER